jgi:DNA-binding CsgD family transcriptional regulator
MSATGNSAPVISSPMAAILDELAYGILLTSVTGSLLGANAAGKRQLEKRIPLRLNAGMVDTVDPCSAGLLNQALKQAEAGGRALVILPVAKEGALSIAVLPFRCSTTGGSGAALILSRPSVCDPLMISFFARSRGLTSSEEQVLALLARGRSAAQVAAELKVAISTARTHIQSVCAKAGCSGVRNLLVLLATLPPLTTVSTSRPLD